MSLRHLMMQNGTPEKMDAQMDPNVGGLQFLLDVLMQDATREPDARRNICRLAKAARVSKNPTGWRIVDARRSFMLSFLQHIPNTPLLPAARRTAFSAAECWRVGPAE